MTAPATQQALHQLVRPLRSRGWLGWIALGLGTAALLLGGWAWSVRLGWFSAPYWVLVAWALALVGLGGIAYLAWRNQRRLTPPCSGPQAGGARCLAAGKPDGTAGQLGVRHQWRAAPAGRSRPGRRNPRARSLGGGAHRSSGSSAAPGKRGFSPDWSPGLYLGGAGQRRGGCALVSPQGVGSHRCSCPAAGRAIPVDRGEPVRLHLEAMGRKAATLWLRSPGESWKPSVFGWIRSAGQRSLPLHSAVICSPG